MGLKFAFQIFHWNTKIHIDVKVFNYAKLKVSEKTEQLVLMSTLALSQLC